MACLPVGRDYRNKSQQIVTLQWALRKDKYGSDNWDDYYCGD